MSFVLRTLVVLGSSLALLFGSCSPKVSDTPLPNARPEGPDTYYYGTPRHGGKQLAGETDAKEHSKPLVLPKPPAIVRKKPSKVAEAAPSSSAAGSGDAGVGPAKARYAGRYLGTDTVTIDFPGVPGDAQVDENAIVDIEKLADEAMYELTVVASNSGEPLCSIRGTLAGEELAFSEGQTCFSEILGVPLETALLGGKATFEGQHISVEFEVELSLDTSGGALDGSVTYSFEGDREASDDADDDETDE